MPERSLLLPTRRDLLCAGGASVVASMLPGHAAAAGETQTHGLSVFGDLALPADFKHFPYVDPQAPKGGQITLQVSSISGNMNFTTFNTLNDFILAGDGDDPCPRAAGVRELDGQRPGNRLALALCVSHNGDS